MKILVTGGAGYIGGAFVRAALAAGHEPVVLDNLSTGHEDAVPTGVELVRADLRERAVLDPLLARCGAVVHFAALSIVPDSIADPVTYYRENLGGFLVLLDGVREHGPARLVFSSSAAVYGDGGGRPFREEDPTRPVNPYGGTKLAMEQTLAHVAPALGLRAFSLRYFNAAGALPDHGERHDPETHLVPLALEAALGRRTLTLFGEDYDTPDGTCIRDYVHVADLAEAHLAALAALERGEGGVLNLGTGRGHSVREVLAAVERVTGRSLPVARGPRREGDPARLVAAVDRAEAVLGWRAARPDLDAIVASAWEWARRLHGG
ncbi:MAG: UDP-glucose 4-epimerase GalE [Candidatus Krumholzibacteriota bacterium]|nr:UDP-glucose 4-epimerase GalE [Candidatus Krumholzibacteriota bacterium]